LTRFEYPNRRPARSTKACQDNARPAQIWTIGAAADARSCVRVMAAGVPET
jgi:hypothetical protein